MSALPTVTLREHRREAVTTILVKLMVGIVIIKTWNQFAITFRPAKGGMPGSCPCWALIPARASMLLRPRWVSRHCWF